MEIYMGTKEKKLESDGNEKLLESIETRYKNTFLVNNKRFVVYKSQGLCLIDDESDELHSIGYSRALEMLHPEIEWMFEDSGEYQGEWVAIGKDNKGIWYYKRGSYGSCSGCDWYQGIEGREDAINYIKAMMLIDKVGTKEELITYLYNEKNNGWGEIKLAIDKLLGHLEGH